MDEIFAKKIRGRFIVSLVKKACLDQQLFQISFFKRKKEDGVKGLKNTKIHRGKRMVKSDRSQTIATTQSFPDIPQNNCENKKNPIPSNLVKVTPILNGDRIPLYLPTMRRFDFDSHPETCLPPPPNYRRFVSFSRKKKKRESDSTDPNPRREGGRGRKKRDGAQGNGESYTYLRTVRGYTWQSAYRSPQEMRYSWESYVAETEADTRDRDTREPI